MKLFTALVVVLGLSSTAQAMPDRWVDDLDLLSLRTELSQVDVNYSYPGLGGGNSPAPDCLMLVTEADGQEDSLRILAAGLDVFDGDAIMFDGPGRELNLLYPQIVDRRLVYYFRDLGKYVTGVRLSAKDGGSLEALVKRAFGEDGNGIVALQVVRSCRFTQQD